MTTTTTVTREYNDAGQMVKETTVIVTDEARDPRLRSPFSGDPGWEEIMRRDREFQRAIPPVPQWWQHPVTCGGDMRVSDPTTYRTYNTGGLVV